MFESLDINLFLPMLDRSQYFAVLKKLLEPNIFFHSLAVEAVMGKLYDYLLSNNLLDNNEPPREEWILAGLIHDIDYFGPYKTTHPNNTLLVLNNNGLSVSDSIISIIKAHSPKRTNVYPVKKAQWSLFCADTLTGLITAVALIMPSKKLADVKLSSVMKRLLKEPRFAATTRREDILQCRNPQGLNMELELFVGLCLSAMQKIAPEINL